MKNAAGKKDDTLDLIVRQLGTVPLDYTDKFNLIKKKRVSDKAWLAAGVLIPLFFRKNPGDAEGGEFVFQLIKRSSGVPQGGDLSGPGGMLNTMLDRPLASLVGTGILPSLKGKARSFLRKRDPASRRTARLFFANALRESWEEVRLNPLNVELLGPLPSYSLTLFTRTIFPLVGLVRKEWNFRPNWEVEKVVEIPLKSLFAEDSYGVLSVEALDERDSSKLNWDLPCLIHGDVDGSEEVLWGATLNIILSFLKIVFNYDPPAGNENKVIKRTLKPGYLTGK
jgi:8-oxo-dGTP pyrophosphatase MutT (NUDIX family)